MAAEVKYISGPTAKYEGSLAQRRPVGVAFYVKVGKSEKLREVVLTRQELIRFVQAALAQLPHLISADLEQAALTGEYKP